MRKSVKFFALLLVAAAGIFATGCPDRTSIADIEHNPSKHINREVVVAGVVKDSYGVSLPGTDIRGGIYKVDDGTGSIWVVTENTVPSKGSEVIVKGTVGNGVSWNGRNYGLGMHENSRKYVKK